MHKHFGGLYTSTRTLNAGDRVIRLADHKRRNAWPVAGTIRYVVHDRLAGRCAMVDWDGGSEQLNLTADLRRWRPR